MCIDGQTVLKIGEEQFGRATSAPPASDSGTAGAADRAAAIHFRSSGRRVSASAFSQGPAIGARNFYQGVSKGLLVIGYVYGICREVAYA
jgi:hypothetical protein